LEKPTSYSAAFGRNRADIPNQREVEAMPFGDNGRWV
jgi:hypothetical protein